MPSPFLLVPTMQFQGGYHHRASAICVEKCLQVLLGEKPARMPHLRGQRPSDSTVESYLNAVSHLRQHWRCLDFYHPTGIVRLGWPKHQARVAFEGREMTAGDASNTGNIDQAALPPIVGDTPKPVPAPTRRVSLVYDHRLESYHYPGEEKYPSERPERVQAVWRRLGEKGLLERCLLLTEGNSPASEEELQLVHEEEFVEDLRDSPRRPEVYRAAALAAGCVLRVSGWGTITGKRKLNQPQMNGVTR